MLCDCRNKRNNKAINIAYPAVSIKIVNAVMKRALGKIISLHLATIHIVGFKYLPEVVVFA